MKKYEMKKYEKLRKIFTYSHMLINRICFFRFN